MQFKFLNTIISLIFFKTLFVVNLFSQQVEIRFNHLSINDGLSQSTVYCILQDNQGYIWAGTQDGLNKFDGYSISQYKHQIDDENSLTNSFINALCKSKDGFWIGTQRGGLNFYNEQNKSFKHISLPGNLDNAEITKVISDREGRIWLGTVKYGLVSFNTADSSCKVFNTQNGLPSNHVIDLMLDGESIIIATNSNQLVKLNFLSDQVELLNNWDDQLKNVKVNCFFREAPNRFLIGTSKGVKVVENNEIANYSSKLDTYQVTALFSDSISGLWIGTYNKGLINCIASRDKYNLLFYQSNDYNLKSLSHNLIHDIYKDETGSLWIGTQDGLSFFDPLKQSFANHSTLLGAMDKNAWGIYEQGDSVLWIGDRNGIVRINNNTNTFNSYPYFSDNKNRIGENDVYDIVIDNQNRIWFASMGGLYLLQPTSDFSRAYYKKVSLVDQLSKIENVIAYDLQLHNNQLWVGCDKGLAVLNLETLEPLFFENNGSEANSLPSGSCRRIYLDRNGVVWVGHEISGLTKLEIDSSNVDSLVFNFTSYNNKNGLSNNTVLSILEGDSGIIWVGTFGGGLNKLITSTGLFSHYTEKDGLSNNSIYGLLHGDEGEIWISTNNGLSCFNIEQESFNVYTESDGLLYNELNNGSFHRGKTGRLYFGGSKGVNSFYPKEIRQNKIPPKIVLNEIEFLFKNTDELAVRYQNTFSLDTLILNYNQNSFIFHFVGIHFTSSKGNKYKIQLMGDGLLEEPRFLRDLKEVNYSNLPNGEYLFKIWAANSDGVWSKPKSIFIKIKSPYWATWRFIAFIIASSILVFWAIYFLRMRSIKRQKRRLAFLVEKRTKTVTRQKEQIEKQNKKIELEKQKAEELLLNILPAETAEELKNKGKARTRQYRMVTVMFTDIKDFTKIAETMKPVDLVKNLDSLFIKFDKIIEKHQIEKIKTMGDAYMAAGGVPLRDKENPINCVLAALEIQQYMIHIKQEAEANKSFYWNLRIGIHTGDVIAGVIGSKRIAYDIWGNTVNIAQRMETSSASGRVNISESTYEYISPFFECSSRGKIPTKNTGEIEMYYVDRIKKHLSQDENGLIPNKKFNDYVNLHIYSSINYKKAERHIMKILREKLPPNLHYHGIHHTLDVVEAVERIAIMEGVLDEDIFVLKSAATYHDAGFVEKYDDNEVVGASMAADILPKYGYTDEQIKLVWALIYATIIPHKPNNHLEQIICDADLDYLGRDDFHTISDTLRRELRDHGKIKSDRLWDEIQVKFLTQHKYFTKSAKKLRGPKKKKHLKEIKLRLKENKYKD